METLDSGDAAASEQGRITKKEIDPGSSDDNTVKHATFYSDPRGRMRY